MFRLALRRSVVNPSCALVRAKPLSQAPCLRRASTLEFENIFDRARDLLPELDDITLAREKDEDTGNSMLLERLQKQRERDLKRQKVDWNADSRAVFDPNVSTGINEEDFFNVISGRNKLIIENVPSRDITAIATALAITAKAYKIELAKGTFKMIGYEFFSPLKRSPNDAELIHCVIGLSSGQTSELLSVKDLFINGYACPISSSKTRTLVEFTPIEQDSDPANAEAAINEVAKKVLDGVDGVESFFVPVDELGRPLGHCVAKMTSHDMASRLVYRLRTQNTDLILAATFGDRIDVQETRILKSNLLFEQYNHINSALKKHGFSRAKAAESLNMTPRRLSIVIAAMRKASVAYQFPELPSWFALEEGIMQASPRQIKMKHRRHVEKMVTRDAQKILFNNGRKKPMTPEELEKVRARQRAILSERIQKFDNRRSTILEMTQKTDIHTVEQVQQTVTDGRRLG